jgi:hypothetical protein
MAEDPTGFTIYHGTPYDFDHSDLEHEGEGTGRAAYGEGIYTAQHPDVAEWYRDQLSDRADLAGKPLQLNAALTNIIGHIYTVRVHRSRDEFIDWDAPVLEQPLKVQNALKRVLGQMPATTTGKDVVKRLPVGDYAKLSAAGKYKNHQGITSTRPGGGENYVIFDPDDATILEKDYEPLAEEDKEPAKRATRVTMDAYTEGEARAPKGAATGGEWTAGGYNPSTAKAQSKGKGKAAKPPKAPKPAGPQGDGAEWTKAENVSTRVPMKGKVEQPGSHSRNDLTVGLESSMKNPERFADRAKLIRTYGGFRKIEGESDRDTVERFSSRRSRTWSRYTIQTAYGVPHTLRRARGLSGCV